MALAPTGVIYTTELYQCVLAPPAVSPPAAALQSLDSRSALFSPPFPSSPALHRAARYCIRAITMTGVSRAVAGRCDGDNAGHWHDGYGTNAMFYQPRGIAVIPPDDTHITSMTELLVADSADWRVVLITVPNDGVGLSLTTTVLGPPPPTGVGAAAVTGANADVPASMQILVDGVGTNARFLRPRNLAVHPTENVAFIADGGAVRVVDMNTWTVVTVAGNNVTGVVFSDSPTVGTNAFFNSPAGLAYYGNVFVADSTNNRIRVVSFPPGSSALNAPVPAATTVIPACDSTWHHVAMVYTPSAKFWQLSAFVDGAYVLQQAAAITLPASAAASSLRIGWSGDLATNGGSLFAGTLNDLRIYSRSLSLEEVVTLSQPELTPFWNDMNMVFPTTAEGALPAAYAYTFNCVAGEFGPTVTLVKNYATDGAWTWQNGVAPACSPCAAGSFSSDGAASCTPCPAGTYAATKAAYGCTACPAGVYTTGSATSQTVVGACTTCAPGFYGTVTGPGTLSAAGCSACPAGIFTAGSAAGSASVAACTVCAPGYAGAVTGSGTAGAAGCSRCAAGSTAFAGASSCATCPAGAYAAAGASSCTACPATITTAGLTTGSPDVTSCTWCAAGYRAFWGASGSGTVFAGGCAPCPAGTYLGASLKLPAGQNECTACPAGISTPQAASTSISACIVCPPNWAGTVMNPGLANASGCTPCGAGQYSYGGTTAGSCSACPPGATLVSATAGCTPSSTTWAGPYDTAFVSPLLNCASGGLRHLSVNHLL